MTGTLLISIIIIVLGIVYLIFKIRNKKIESGFTAVFITTGIALVTSSFGTIPDKLIAIFTEESVTNNVLQLITGFILIFMGIWMSIYVRNKLNILNLIGVKERRIEDHNEDVNLNLFEFKEREIDLSIPVTKEMTEEMFQNTVELLEYKVSSFDRESREVKKGYTGTAPIPLTLYAGHCSKGKPTDVFFEYNRFKSKYQKLKKTNKWLFSKRKYQDLSLEQPIEDLDINNNEVILGVGITMPIKKEQVQQFNAPFIYLSIESPVPNAIQYEEQLHEYVRKIYNVIIQLNDYSCISKIHLVMSSQSCLPFELGKQLTTETYMKEIVSYHFVNNKQPNYPWGIAFNNKGIRYITT